MFEHFEFFKLPYWLDTKHFRYLKWRNPHLYKLYGYGLCKEKPTPKIAKKKVQETLHFRYLKCLVNQRSKIWPLLAKVEVPTAKSLLCKKCWIIWKLTKLERDEIPFGDSTRFAKIWKTHTKNHTNYMFPFLFCGASCFMLVSRFWASLCT